MANRKKNNNFDYRNIIFIIVFLLFLILLLFIYLKNSKERFETNTVDVDGLPLPNGPQILEDCKQNYAVINKNQNPSYTVNCNDSAWVKNPKLLCGICDGINGNEISTFSMTDPVTRNPINFYGCSNSTTKNNVSISTGVKWNLPPPSPNSKQPTKLNSYLSDKLTCQFYSQNAVSDLCLMVACSNSCTIYINGKTITQTMDQQYKYYYVQNVKNNANIVIITKTSSSNIFGGVSVSYIWNKQLYILDNNNYTNCANIMSYNVTNQNTDPNLAWSNMWYTDKGMKQLPLWMQNWIRSKDGSTNQIQQMRVSFNVGATNPAYTPSLNNDLVLFLGVQGTADISLETNIPVITNILSNNQHFTTSGSTTKSYVIENISEEYNLKINGSDMNGGGMYFMYLWSGFIYMLDGGTIPMTNFYDTTKSTPLNFNMVNRIEYTKTNLDNYTLDPYVKNRNSQDNSNNPFFVNRWLKANNNNNNTCSISITLQSLSEDMIEYDYQNQNQNKKIDSFMIGNIFMNNNIDKYKTNSSDYNTAKSYCETKCKNKNECNSFSLLYNKTSDNDCILSNVAIATKEDTSTLEKYIKYIFSIFNIDKTYNTPREKKPDTFFMYDNYDTFPKTSFVDLNNVIPNVNVNTTNINECKSVCGIFSDCKGFTTNIAPLATERAFDNETQKFVPGYSCKFLNALPDDLYEDRYKNDLMNSYIL